MLNYNKYLWLVIFIFGSCTKPGQDPHLQQAAALHLEALQIAEDLEDQLKQGAIPSDSAAVLQAAIEAWEKDLVEVPGYEHEHDHAGHNHSHEPVQVTPEEMLQLQQAAKAQIEQLKKRFDSQTH